MTNKDQYQRVVEGIALMVAPEWSAVPGAEEIAETLAPKAAGYLFPFTEAIALRERIEKLRGVPLIYPVVWQAALALWRWRSRAKKWPVTMEMNLRKPITVNDVIDISLASPVLLVLSMRSYAAMMAATAAALAAEGEWVVILAPVVAKEWHAFDTLPDRVSLRYFEEFVTENISENYIKSVTEAEQGWESTKGAIAKNGNEPLRDTLAMAPGATAKMAIDVLPQVPAFNAVARQIFAVIKPKSLLVTRLKRIVENVFARQAKRAGVPVVLANHGHIGSGWAPLSLGAVDKLADLVLAWGDKQKEVWQRLFPELEPTHVVSVGGLLWDASIKRHAQSDEVARRTLRNNLLSKVTEKKKPDCDDLWITITIDYILLPSLDAIVAATNCPGVSLLIKTRPDESKIDYAPYAEKATVLAHETKIDLHELLAASDLMITTVSTTNIDGLAVGTPVMTVALDDGARNAEYYVSLEEYGLPFIQSATELRRVINEWVAKISLRKEWKAAAKVAAASTLANYPQGDAAARLVSMLSTFTHMGEQA